MTETRPTKRVKLLADDASDGDGEAPNADENLKINDEFAKRFEHNKKRDELMRCESCAFIYKLVA